MKVYNIEISKMTVMFRLVIISIILSFGIGVDARTISGLVVDDNGNAVEFANVLLLNDTVFIRGRVTDENGLFLFENIDSCQYNVKISMIGYEEVDSFITDIADVKIDVVLKQSALLLSDVEVVGTRPRTLLKGNAFVTNVDNTILSTLGSANDVLRHIPMVTGNDGNFVVFGRGDATIYINGRRIRNNSEIEQLSSEDIKSIEVVTSPGAKYASDVKAVIRILTRKPIGDGFSLLASSRLSYNRRLMNKDQVNLKFRNNGIEVFGNFYGEFGSYYHEEYPMTTIINGNQWLTEATKYIEFARHRQLSGKTGFNYQINEKHSVGAYYENQIQRQHIDGDYSTIIKEDGKLADISGSESDKHLKKYPGHSANIYYNGNIDKFNLDFNTDYLYSKSRKTDYQYESNLVAPDRHIMTDNISRGYLFAEKAVLSYTLPKGEVLVGEEFTATKSTNSFDNPQGILRSELNKVTENNIGVFAELSQSLGKFTGTIGLRYEHVVFNYYVNNKKEDGQSKCYNRFFPSINVGFNTGDFAANFSYGTRTERPSYSSLSGNYQYYTPLSYIRGNPSLIPELITELSIQASWKFIYLNAQYSNEKNSIMRVYKPYDEDWRITVLTPVNFPHLRSFTFYVGASPEIGKWEPSINFGFRKQWLDVEYLGCIRRMNTPSINIQINNFFSITPDFYLQSVISWQSTGDFGNWHNPRTTSFVNVGLMKMLFDRKLSVGLIFNDIFNGQLDYGEIYSGNVYTKSWAKNYRRNLELMIRYKFNTTNSRYKGRGAGQTEKDRL
ncbi:TonB dependent receptor [Muribaculum intestinale]|uniref:TonB dependent receptor n=1 Tax=Muribaculum intestinale TaxID=1796646 RepID=UPI0025A95658|nr:TonB dependent receptor [Muribaculum intestinale]